MALPISFKSIEKIFLAIYVLLKIVKIRIEIMDIVLRILKDLKDMGIRKKPTIEVLVLALTVEDIRFFT